MPLNAGTRLASYEIVAPLGAGGMGEVYRAHDTRLRRDVAVKVLPSSVASDPERLRRFEQEALATAALNHPNILSVHDVGTEGETTFVVAELLEGRTLREVIEDGTLSLRKAVDYATQIARGLAAAHGKGIVHRDLKPDNVFVTDDERVKILDFGLAKVTAEHPDALATVTAVAPGTEPGVVLGTIGYMAPEQVRGVAIDHRADLFSFGAVLYEMLTGTRAFRGETAADTMTAILKKAPPELTESGRPIPAGLARVVERCLEKTPAARFQSASDLAFALESLGSGSGSGTGLHPAPAAEVATTRATERAWKRIAVAMTAVAIAAVAAVVWLGLGSSPSSAVSRFIVGLRDTAAFPLASSVMPSKLSVAPDGSGFVYIGQATGALSQEQLYLQTFASLEPRALPGTTSAVSPAFSPDGGRVAFLSDAPGEGGMSLKVVGLDGSPPVTLVTGARRGGGVAWGPDEFIYYVEAGQAGPGRRIMRVSASGGAAEEVVEVVLDGGLAGLKDLFVVSPHQMLVTAEQGGLTRPVPDQSAEATLSQVVLIDLDTGQSTFSVPGAGGRVSPSGHLLYVTGEGALMAQPFSPGDDAPSGRAAVVLENVAYRGAGNVDVVLSSEGTLMYVEPTRQGAEQWMLVSADGQVRPFDADWTAQTEFEGIALSPDGTRLAVEVRSDDLARSDIWIKHVGGGAPSRLTFEGDINGRPVWSPDGQRIGYVSSSSLPGAGGDALVRRADGSGGPDVLLDHELDIVEVAWSSDEQWVIAVLRRDGNSDIAVSGPGPGREATPLLASSADEGLPALSPDDRWLAYVSDETGRGEVFVVPFPNVGDGKWQITTRGAGDVRWSRDGRQLFVRNGGTMDAFDMTRGPASATRTRLFERPEGEFWESQRTNTMFEVTDDGRFIMLSAGEGDVSGDLIMVRNFFAELRRLVPR